MITRGGRIELHPKSACRTLEALWEVSATGVWGIKGGSKLKTLGNITSSGGEERLSEWPVADPWVTNSGGLLKSPLFP